MQHRLSLITLGITDPARSRRYYSEGFGWSPVFEADGIAFYQMNGFIFGTWLRPELEKDMQLTGLASPGAFALAHNVAAREDVEPMLDKLVAAGGKLLRHADEPEHGGLRGYVADPDGHGWEIAWNPFLPIAEDGTITFPAI
ncbi:VOC family protein [Croceicoccus gelatinilyticus]|uniref:VOC family protein n=1 Tax=Croceicoccus gelatinilyticus TaxID=2835536 RepID=UPI001BCB3912|nr:VOC family protein [Croceicoccus gelatinilyticus]MBS7668999.1 VOC family protein [Croceicoccus gelatinilyticus]